ncbi:hypothetical protein C0Q70_16973 [Pomacea canaliculata]|uniref:Uncharacterized protein n=1 Tax=Pomacea canaliculata TaxID=400727 RepID=A0A2T7NR98_POMCA|nr:hypothetical protein C0Q70_16973 [Pomacea canaliculata]
MSRTLSFHQLEFVINQQLVFSYKKKAAEWTREESFLDTGSRIEFTYNQAKESQMLLPIGRFIIVTIVNISCEFRHKQTQGDAVWGWNTGTFIGEDQKNVKEDRCGCREDETKGESVVDGGDRGWGGQENHFPSLDRTADRYSESREQTLLCQPHHLSDNSGLGPITSFSNFLPAHATSPSRDQRRAQDERTDRPASTIRHADILFRFWTYKKERGE